MISKELLNAFIKEVDKAWQQFCVWMYSYNKFVEYQKKFNKDPNCIRYKGNIIPGCRYKNFWDICLLSLQHSFILSVERLIQPPYFQGDKKKKRLSVYYILELLEEGELKAGIKKRLGEQEDFLKSIKRVRNNRLAHNGLDERVKTVKKGIETFFKNMESSIKEIKQEKDLLKSCDNFNCEYVEGLSKTGVDEIFEDLIKGRKYNL